MTAANRKRLRLSALAAVSATTSVGTVMAGGGTAFAVSPTVAPPILTATLATYGAPVDGDLTAALPNSGTLHAGVRFVADPHAGLSGVGIAAVTVDCGRPGDVPHQAGGPSAGNVTGFYPDCTYTAAGTYSVTVTATDTQTPAQSTSVTHVLTVTTTPQIAIDRYDGDSRYGTGVAVSQAAFPAAGSADAVVLARGDVFADALAGIPLAKYKNGPLLLTPGGPAVTHLDPNVEHELLRVLPRDKSHTVYILGGTSAIPQPVEDYISGTLGYNVVRLSGQSRYDTALAIAKDPRALDNPQRVVVARGDDFADALAAGSFAANAYKGADGRPAAIVLSNGPAKTATIDPNTAAYVETKFAEPEIESQHNVALIGGGAQAAVQVLPNANPHFDEYSGATRYDTALAVATAGWGVNGNPATISSAIDGVVTGTSAPDALTGGAYMALKNGPLLLADPTRQDNAAGEAIADGKLPLNVVAVFGGGAVLPQSIVTGYFTAAGLTPSSYTDHHLMF